MIGTRARIFLPSAVFVLPALGACVGGSGAASGIHMWPTGKSVTYEVSSTGSMTRMGAMTTTATTDLRLEVVGMAGDRVFKVTLTAATISSDAEAMGEGTPDMAALVGFESTVTLDDQGRITHATSLEDPVLSKVGGPQAFQEILQGLFIYLPEGGMLGPGVTWERDHSYEYELYEFLMERAESDTYICDERTTYDGFPAYKITSRSTAALNGVGDPQGVQVNMGASGNGEATIYIEVGTGRILLAQSSFALSGGMEVPAMDVSFPIDIGQTKTVRPAR